MLRINRTELCSNEDYWNSRCVMPQFRNPLKQKKIKIKISAHANANIQHKNEYIYKKKKKKKRTSQDFETFFATFS